MKIMLPPVWTALVFWSTCLGPLKILPFLRLASEHGSESRRCFDITMYLKCGFIPTFAHSPIREKLVKLLDAEGENNGSLGFKVIVGHRWCLDTLARLWNWV